MHVTGQQLFTDLIIIWTVDIQNQILNKSTFGFRFYCFEGKSDAIVLKLNVDECVMTIIEEFHVIWSVIISTPDNIFITHISLIIITTNYNQHFSTSQLQTNLISDESVKSVKTFEGNCLYDSEHCLCSVGDTWRIFEGMMPITLWSPADSCDSIFNTQHLTRSESLVNILTPNLKF